MSTGTNQSGTIERVGYRLASVVERWMPSPFLFAILLTYLVFVAALVLGEFGLIESAEGGAAGPFALVEHWFDGFWNFLEFAMQMTLILMTGFALAYHPRANDLLVRLAKVPDTAPQAVILVAVFSMAIAWIHWGFSLILGAIFAREMGKVAYEKGIDVHYPLLALSGYMGLALTWHWGLSGSAPLLLTDAAQVGEGTAFHMVPEEGIPLSQTIMHGYGITLTVLSIVFAALVLYLITPSGERSRDITEYIPESELFDTAGDGGETVETESEPSEKPAPAERIDNNLVLGGLIGLTGFGYVLYLLVSQGIDALNLNVVNFGFLMAGLLIWTNPSAYRDKFGEAATAAAGVILLFPFFAGIQGIMAGSGLAAEIADAMVGLATESTFPVIAWLTAAIVNAFVPSGGGEWIILGPSILEAANDLGVDLGHATMAYAVGDAHTNLLNPFWAIPLLAITRIKAREMFGYAIVMMLALFPFLAAVLYLLPYEALAF
ncbi:short-chain fatty acid transporter [Natronobacterium texcoconense]|uniref:Short-chain fatty acids transporter n=1 Tax=Natronobacterium texcoconense TaxID=1095778 RepID=A0A1H0YVU2_NATTX|nr:TIGR00366 family protein [Natronobacterium texcoconense]SDQ19218.1 short-chain fatty acids transporter [Natronobacterium texcoconense]